MRKLAREAIIFVLLTPVAVFAGSFSYLYYDAHKHTDVPRHGPDTITLDMSTDQPIPCTAGDKYVDGGRLVWSCQRGVRTSTVDYDKLAREAGAIDPYAGLVQKSTSESDPFAGIAKPIAASHTPTE